MKPSDGRKIYSASRVLAVNKPTNPQAARTNMIGWRGIVLWVLGGTVLGFILGGPIGALVVGVLGYFLPLRLFNGKWSHKNS